MWSACSARCSCSRPREDIVGLARGIAYQLVETLGVLERSKVADDLKSLDQASRAVLRSHGVRFGAYHIYLPSLLKPAPRALAAQLWALKHGGPDMKGLDDLQRLAASGRTSFAADKDIQRALYRTIGYRVCAERAVRVDILERLADLIRPALAWRPNSSGVRPAGAFEGLGFTVTQAMTSLTGSSGEDFASILRALGYRMEKRPKPPEPVVPPPVAEATSVVPAADAGNEVTQTAPSDDGAVAHVAADAPASGEPDAGIETTSAAVEAASAASHAEPSDAAPSDAAPSDAERAAAAPIQEPAGEPVVTASAPSPADAVDAASLQHAASEHAASDKVVSDDSMSEEVVSDDNVSEEAVSEDTVSEDTVSEDRVSEETASEDGVSEDIAVEETASDAQATDSAAAGEVSAPAAAVTADAGAVAGSEAATDEARTEAAASEAAAEPELVEVWRPGGRSEERRGPRRPARRPHRGGDRPNQPAEGVAAAAGETPAVAAAAGSESEKPPERRHHRRGPPPRRDQGSQPEARESGDRRPEPRPESRPDWRGDRRRGAGDRPPGFAKGRQDRQDRGHPDHRHHDAKDRRDAPPRREREKQPDPNSPFAKLAALKAQLEANAKEPH